MTSSPASKGNEENRERRVRQILGKRPVQKNVVIQLSCFMTGIQYNIRQVDLSESHSWTQQGNIRRT